MGVARIIRNGLSELLALVFPSRCGACTVALAAGDGPLCVRCTRQTLELLRLDYCNRCGQDRTTFALAATGRPGVNTCGQCDDSLYRYAALVRACSYQPPVDALIRRFKYQGARHLSGVLGRWQADRLAGQPWREQIDALVPVPLHWRRELLRGFNQSHLLAERIGDALHLAVESILSRPLDRPPQASLPRSARFENVRGAFAVRAGCKVRGRTFCLIDDVCTTGATLSEAARTLRNAGAREVYAAVAATAQPPDPFAGAIIKA